MNAALATSAPAGQILFDLPADEYQRRELGVASSGVLVRLLKKTPAHVKAWVEQPDETTDAKAFGQAYHCRILEPERFAALYVAPPKKAPRRPSVSQLKAKKPSSATIATIEFWRAWDAEHAGQIILAPKDRDKIEVMAEALKAHPLANALLFECEGDSEVTFRWADEATGVPCKARLDRWQRRRRTVVDLKTADDAGPVAFSKSVAKYGYHIQQAHYCEGARAVGEPVNKYLIVVQEKEAPYLVAVYQLDAATETLGYEQRQQGVQTIAECITANEWPGYAPDAQELSLPAWAFGEAMEISYVD